MALPPELSLGPGQFSAAIDAELCIECRKIRIDPKPPRPPKGRDKEQPNDPPRDDRTHPIAELTCFKLRVFAVGHLEHVLSASGGTRSPLLSMPSKSSTSRPTSSRASLSA